MKIEEVFNRVTEGRSILHTVKRRKANWIGHILRRKCLVKYVIEGGIKRKIRRGRRRKMTLRKREDAVNLNRKQ